MPLIELGRDRNGKDVNMIENYGYGVIHVIAQPRYGKSILVKNIYTQIAKHRNLIILDYQNEHQESRWGNFSSKDKIRFIPDLKNIENFGFYLSDFTQYLDWKSMGFTSNTIPLIKRLLLKENVHQNDPVVFMQILRDLPVNTDELEQFREDYPDYEKIDAQNYSAKQSIVSKFEAVLDSKLIIPPYDSENYEEYADGMMHIEDWPQLVRDHPHLNINLAMFSSDAEQTARASVGKILEKLLPALSELKPLIVVEEADKLCPDTGDEFDSTSQKQLREYTIKHQRSGVKLMFITQQPNLLDEDTLGAGMVFIFGIHTPNSKSHSILDAPGFDYQKNVVKYLKHDNLKGHRDFGIIEVGQSGKYRIFTPMDSSTRIPRKLNLRSKFLRNREDEPSGILKKLMFKKIEDKEHSPKTNYT